MYLTVGTGRFSQARNVLGLGNLAFVFTRSPVHFLPRRSPLSRGRRVYFSSIIVVNFTEPSFEISTRGAVPRIPMVPTGVSIFI
jgi:hypothetical protein